MLRVSFHIVIQSSVIQNTPDESERGFACIWTSLTQTTNHVLVLVRTHDGHMILIHVSISYSIIYILPVHFHVWHAIYAISCFLVCSRPTGLQAIPHSTSLEIHQKEEHLYQKLTVSWRRQFQQGSRHTSPYTPCYLMYCVCAWSGTCIIRHSSGSVTIQHVSQSTLLPIQWRGVTSHLNHTGTTPVRCLGK